MRVSPVIGASVSATILGAVWWLLAARFAAPDQAGCFVTALGIATLLAEVANLGVTYLLIRHFAGAGARGPALVRTGLALVTVVVASVVGLLAYTAPAVRLPGLSGIVAYGLFLMMALGIAWYAITDALLLATGRRWLLFARSFVTSLGRVVLLAALISIGSLSWPALLIGFAAPQLLSSVIILTIARVDVFGGMRQRLFLNAGEMYWYALYAGPSYIGNLITALVPNLLPLLVVWQLGPVTGAQFGLMWSIAGMMMLAPAAVSLTSFASGARGEGPINQIVRQSNWLLLAIELPFVVAVLMLAPLLFRFLGSAYEIIQQSQLAPLLLGVVCVGFTSQMYARARLHPRGLRVVIAGQSVQAVVVLNLALLLMPALGLLGVSLAWLTGSTITLMFVSVLERSRICAS